MEHITFSITIDGEDLMDLLINERTKDTIDWIDSSDWIDFSSN